MQPIELKPGMRVRCVVADAFGWLRVGVEYRVAYAGIGHVRLVGNESAVWRADRFKPVIRVKMRAKPSLDILIKRALARFDQMSPAEKEAHFRAQRDSWVRGEMALSKMGLG